MVFLKLLPHLVVVGCLMVTVTSQRPRNGGNRRERNRNQASAATPDFIGDLEKFGYLDDLATGTVGHSENSVANALTTFQRFNGLEVTGEWNEETRHKMGQPRCGMPDVVKPAQRPQQFNNEDNSPGAPIAYHAPGYKWESNQVTYKVESFTRQLNTQDQSRTFASAFQKWADVTPLRFRRSNGDADIMIKFGVREHGDGAGNAFDGRSGTLAHAFFPGRHPISGDTHFDDEEQWTLGEDRGSNLEIVAAHEFGHALGLGHSSTPQALMAPYYSYDPNYSLHSDDIRGIQQLYGSAPRGRTPRPVTTRRPVVTTPRRRGGDGNSPCNLRFDAIEQIHDGKILAFQGRDVFTITSAGPSNSTRIKRMFPGAPTNVNAVVYDRNNRNLYFFKGRKFWKYRGYRKQPGYPKELPTPFQRIRAAMQWRDGRIYLFKGRDYMAWTEGLTRMPSGYPRRTRDYWGRFPSNPDAAYRSYDGYYYVFKFYRYWRFNSRATMSPGYPKDTKTIWLNCNRSRQLRTQARSPNNLFSWLSADINNRHTQN